MSAPSDPFAEITSGILGVDGKPIGSTQVHRDPIDGVEWGMAFLAMRDGVFALCHLEADDCWAYDVQVGAEENGIVQSLALRVKPQGVQFGQDWNAIPQAAFDVLDARREFLKQVQSAAAAEEARIAAQIEAELDSALDDHAEQIAEQIAEEEL